MNLRLPGVSLKQPSFDWRRLTTLSAMLFVIVAVGAGCATSFKYRSDYAHSFSPMAGEQGLAIRTGQDARPMEERQPAWAADAEKIVARALADEVKHAKLVRRVKIHADAANPKKYPLAIAFRVEKFECHNQAAFLEGTGRTLLELQGIRGALIAESIPSKYISEVQVDFEVSDVATGQSFLTKTYSAMRTERLNGYQGENAKVLLTSGALEEVVTQFLSDLTKVHSGEHSH